jgi:uncharacterized delta-60 repeat protein
MKQSLQAVALDPAFAERGVRLFSYPDATQTGAIGMATAPDGNIYVAGNLTVAAPATQGRFWLTRITPHGQVDSSFGNNGVVIDDFAAGGHSIAFEVSVLKDGNILLSGNHGARASALARYLPSGSLNLVFGNSGKVVLDAEQGQAHATGQAATQAGAGSAGAHSLELPDGKFITLANYSESAHDWIKGRVYRLTATGDIDSSFAGKGYVDIEYAGAAAGNTLIKQVRLQADGKFLLSGTAGGGTQPRQALFTRLHPDGSRDLTFGDNGFQVVALDASIAFATQFMQYDNGEFVALYNQVVPRGAVLLGQQANGAANPAFNQGQPLPVHLEDRTSVLNTAALDERDNILVAGGSLDPQSGLTNVVLARYLRSGQLDPTFNDKGSAVLPIGSGENYASAVTVQADGNLLIAGKTDAGGFVARLLI